MKSRPWNMVQHGINIEIAHTSGSQEKPQEEDVYLKVKQRARLGCLLLKEWKIPTCSGNKGNVKEYI